MFVSQTVNWADSFTFVFVAELVRVAMAAAEGEGHTAADIVVVVPSGDWNAARSRVHRQRAHVYRTHATFTFMFIVPSCHYRRRRAVGLRRLSFFSVPVSILLN